MTNSDIFSLVDILVGLIILPWSAWVTSSIFSLKTQNAILKEHMDSIHRVETLTINRIEELFKHLNKDV